MQKYIQNPKRLRVPERQYDPAKSVEEHDVIINFESKASVRTQDQLRAKSLQAGDAASVVLGNQLSAAIENHQIPQSFASNTFYRELRRRLVGELLSFTTVHCGEGVFTPFTLVPPKLRYTLEELADVKGDKAKNLVLRLLRQHGIFTAPGWLFAGLHGEWDGTHFQLHFHGIATGEKAELLPLLRNSPSLKPTVEVDKPLMLSPTIDGDDILNLMRWYTYCLQSFWPSRELFLGTDGKTKRQRIKRRMAKPVEAEALKWMSMRNLGEIVIFSGSQWEREDQKMQLKPSAV
jgi:hypothetical protein